MDGKDKCVLCGPQGALALFGLALGFVFIFIGVDVLTDSKLSGAIGKRREVSTDDESYDLD